MKRTTAVILAVLVVAALIVYTSIFIVNERQQAIVLRFGEITRVIEEPGIYFKIPTNFVETVQIIEDRLLYFELEDLRVQVRDGRRYLVSAFVTYQITDPREFRENISGSLQIAEDNMRTRLDAALRRVYGGRSFEAALSEQRAEMMVEVQQQLQPLTEELGINIVDVRIKRTDLLPEVSQQTFERMRAERLAEAAQLRARGNERAARIRAEADREAVVTVAEAEREAEILRGQGDADRNRIFAEAYQRNPNFFDFYRSMRAYESSLRGGDTTLLLSPDSEFFRFFRDATGGAEAFGPATASQPAPEATSDPGAAPEAAGGAGELGSMSGDEVGSEGGGMTPAEEPAAGAATGSGEEATMDPGTGSGETTTGAGTGAEEAVPESPAEEPEASSAAQ